MSSIITTNANRVKAAGYWCEDADAQTAAFLEARGLSWEDEVPVIEGLSPDGLGLANTLLALGACHPRFMVRADKILRNYIAYLYDTLDRLLVTKHNVTFKDLRNTITHLNRAATRRQYTFTWQKIKEGSVDPSLRAACDAMLVLLSEAPLHIKALHSGKHIITAYFLAKEPSIMVNLTDTLRDEINNG